MSYPLISRSLLALCFMVLLTSCLKDNEVDYSDWEQRNTQYVLDCENATQNGMKEFTRVAPAWSPEAFSLVKWHNDRALTASALMPMDNSVCHVKYEVSDIDGNLIDSSYKSTVYGDSIYQCRPNMNITGFWATLTHMHVGDSVTSVIPAISAYGSVQNGQIKPYSTLVYKIKLVSIPFFEVPAH